MRKNGLNLSKRRILGLILVIIGLVAGISPMLSPASIYSSQGSQYAVSDLTATVLDSTTGKAVNNAIVSYQNKVATTDETGKAVITNIPDNITWLFTVSADNYNILTESLRLTGNESRTFRITTITSTGEATPAPTSPAPLPDINVKIHVTGTGGEAISLAAVNALGKLRYTNVYGDADFPISKGTKTIEISVNKEGFTGTTQKYGIPDALLNDDLKINIEMDPTTPITAPIIDLTKLESPEKGTSSLKIPIILILGGLLLLLAPENRKRRTK